MPSRPADREAAQPSYLKLTLAVIVLFLWTWDVSWSATVPGARAGRVAHDLALLLTLTWAGGVALARPGSAPWIMGTLSAGVMVLAAAALGRLLPGGLASGTGYLNAPTALLTGAIGVLGVLSLLATLHRPARGVPMGVIVAGGVLLLWISVLLVDYLGWPNLWRGTEFLMVGGAALGFPLAFLAWALPGRFAATGAALACTGMLLASGALMAAVPPRAFVGGAGPEHFVVVAGPLGVVLPAAAMDLVARKWADAHRRAVAVRAVGAGALFVAALWAGHWLLSGLFVGVDAVGAGVAELWWPPRSGPGDWAHRYWTVEGSTLGRGEGWGVALAAAAVSTGSGAWLAQRTRRVTTVSAGIFTGGRSGGPGS